METTKQLASYMLSEMSPEQQQQRDFEESFTVFHGSSPEDVSHARRLWSSLSLLPPLESRLVSADIRQRLPVSRPQRGGSSSAAPRLSAPPPRPPSVAAARQRLEERRRYEAMADRRKETMALLRRQREIRIRKEMLSAGFKPKIDRENVKKRPESREVEEEMELVKQLQ